MEKIILASVRINQNAIQDNLTYYSKIVILHYARKSFFVIRETKSIS